jgi:hypothetical protein
MLCLARWHPFFCNGQGLLHSSAEIVGIAAPVKQSELIGSTSRSTTGLIASFVESSSHMAPPQPSLLLMTRPRSGYSLSTSPRVRDLTRSKLPLRARPWSYSDVVVQRIC